MNELIDYTLIENEILKDSISDFLSEIREKSPEYFNSLGVKTVLHRGYAEVFVLLNKQVMMEHLVDELANVLGIHVLYAVRDNKGQTYKAVAYSVPVENKMYVIHLASQQYGVIENMTVNFYDSLEIMYKQVCKEFTNMPKFDMFILEKEKYSDVINSFY